MLRLPTALAGILLFFLTLAGYGSAGETAPPVLVPSKKADDPTAWGRDGTRELLSGRLERFFNGATGAFIAVRDQDKGRKQSNGEYLLADQIRLPLFGVAAPKVVEPGGSTIYQAFVFGNPYVSVFIKADVENNVEAVALADTEVITKHGSVVDSIPRLTVFYRQGPFPTDLRDEAVRLTDEFYSRVAPTPMMRDNSIKVYEHKLS